jgi:guanylate kinase
MSAAPACLVIAGPSGVGKSTLIRGALERNSRWAFSVSATTRPKREGEVDGRDYHFIDRAEFEARILRGELLEYADVYNELYGTPVSELTQAAAQNKHLLIEVDTVGCLSIRALRPDIPLAAVLPPSIAELKRRLADRATEDPQALARRMANTVAELQRMRGFDFAVVNDDIEQAQQQLLDVMAILERGLTQVAGQVDALLKQVGGDQ